MRAVLQRVLESSVRINGEKKGEIGKGLMILLGVESSDNHEDISWLSKKIVNLRIFNDDQNVMNKSVLDVGGDILLISQFTLHASTKKGNRPSYSHAAPPEIAVPCYQAFIKQLEADLNKPIQTGEFGADMKVSLVNDGPVTIFIDTKNKK